MRVGLGRSLRTPSDTISCVCGGRIGECSSHSIYDYINISSPIASFRDRYASGERDALAAIRL